MKRATRSHRRVVCGGSRSRPSPIPSSPRRSSPPSPAAGVHRRTPPNPTGTRKRRHGALRWTRSSPARGIERPSARTSPGSRRRRVAPRRNRSTSAKSTASRGGAVGRFRDRGFVTRRRASSPTATPPGSRGSTDPAATLARTTSSDVRRALSLGGAVTQAPHRAGCSSPQRFCARVTRASPEGGGGRRSGGRVAWPGLLIARATTNPDAPWPKVPSLLALCYYFCPTIVVVVGFAATRLYPEDGRGVARR